LGNYTSPYFLRRPTLIEENKKRGKEKEEKAGKEKKAHSSKSEPQHPLTPTKLYDAKTEKRGGSP
jgi:hypothetical protein